MSECHYAYLSIVIMSQRRSEDTGTFTRDFTDTVLVVCPKCSERAHVHSGTRLICPACGLSKTREMPRLFAENSTCFERSPTVNDWYGALRLVATETSRCKTCGSMVKINTDIRCAGSRPNVLVHQCCGDCGTCGTNNIFDGLWVPFFEAGEARDPNFGACLYLAEETAKGQLWAYNRAHAEALLDFISAKLREGRVGNDGAKTMVTMLPSWMKSAKNRTLIEKTLNKMIGKSC